MATLLPAVLTKFAALDASLFAGGTVPPAYHDEAPQVRSGAQLRPPYAVVSLVKGQVVYTFEADEVEVTRVTVEVYDTDEGSLDAAVAAVRLNGGTVGQALGFDNGTLPALTDGTLLTMLLDGTPTKHHDGVERGGVNVYRAELSYEVVVQRS